MLSVAEASERILADIRRLDGEEVALRDSLGRVLASDIISPVTLPAWDNSAMDGYAVHGDDVRGATADGPVSLPIVETIAAGAFASQPLPRGSAMRIMTGAPLPEGCDTVIRQEDTDGGIERVAVRDARDVGKNIRRRGEDIRAGVLVLAAGTPLGAAQLGVLSSVGASRVTVSRQPRVAFLGSGDELVDVDGFAEVLAGRKIVSSNSYTLDALIRLAGGVPVNLGVARDDPADLRTRLDAGLGADLLITTAGISVGEFDYVRSVLAELGADLRFWKVRMRPGAPIGFGLLRGVPWLGLPGNPVSTMVTFDLFVRPVIRRMLGHARPFRRPVPVVLEEAISIGAPLTHFLRAIVTPRPDGRLTARLTGSQGSGILTSMALANALLVVPLERKRYESGESLNALLLGEDAYLAEHFEL
ncbi:MAG: molybdopterin molybdotransferase MoeA [Gemmatimonadota bacterium]|nr:molybdopterin molybdotransferase MoeA [Gemmatimonadota bacterium]